MTSAIDRTRATELVETYKSEWPQWALLTTEEKWETFADSKIQEVAGEALNDAVSFLTKLHRTCTGPGEANVGSLPCILEALRRPSDGHSFQLTNEMHVNSEQLPDRTNRDATFYYTYIHTQGVVAKVEVSGPHMWVFKRSPAEVAAAEKAAGGSAIKAVGSGGSEPDASWITESDSSSSVVATRKKSKALLSSASRRKRTKGKSAAVEWEHGWVCTKLLPADIMPNTPL